MLRNTVLSVMSLAMLASVAGTRCGILYSDIKLLGPIGSIYERMVANHVTATDPLYLASCFKSRKEKELWQTEFWGKYMHAACPILENSRNVALRERINASVAAVLETQDEEGYIGNFVPEQRMAPCTWDVWGVKYTMMGLLHHYDVSGDRKSLDACLRLCRYVAKKVGRGSKTTISETGYYAGLPSCSILEPVVWLYNRTKDKDVLAFADFIVEEMANPEKMPRLIDLALQGVPVANRSDVPAWAETIWKSKKTNRGKAYEMMSCYQGLLEYYEVTGRKELLDAAVKSADDIIASEINLAGGAASEEHWYNGTVHQHEPFPCTQETCVTITWMRLCAKLLAVTGNVKYADEFEKTFFNAYLASLNRTCDEFACYTPLSGTRSKGRMHCKMHTNCCNANGPRGFIALLQSLLHADGGTIYVNQYVSSIAGIRIPDTGDNLVFETHSLYPKDGSVDMLLRSPKELRFVLALRIPACVASARVTVDGHPISDVTPGTWLKIDRTWQDGDAVQLVFDMPVRIHRIADSVAFTRGPVLLARDSRFRDGELSEPLRGNVVRMDVATAFKPVRSPDESTFWMAFEAVLPWGSHVESADGRLGASVMFCDYSSAANSWRPGAFCRTWFDVERDILSVLK